MPDRGKSRFNRVGCADALPKLGREVEECHEFAPVLLQAQHRLGELGLIGFDEQIEGLLGILFGHSLPDVVDRGLCLCLSARFKMS